MKKRIAVLAGDGIGPEEMAASLPLLETVAAARCHQIEFRKGLVGWAAYDAYGDVMPKATWDLCGSSDVILFGAVGLPKRDSTLPLELRPERRALLPIRKKFGLGVNIRPVRIYPGLEEIASLNRRLIEGGVEVVFFRELLGGDYFGRKTLDPRGKWATDECHYRREQIVLIARAAFEEARRTGRKVTSVDKANVLGAAGTFWRNAVSVVHKREFTDVRLEHMFVDAASARLVACPKSLEIVLTSNLFGDILSDQGGGIAGSLGLLPSASLNPKTGYGMYEPAAGSAPDIAGKGIANPIGMVLSIALMFRHTFRDEKAAQAIEQAVEKALARGFRTSDIGDGSDVIRLTTLEMVNTITSQLELEIAE